jgi:hypothetical protein
MKELKVLERILNLSIQKGVFSSLQEVSEAINCLDAIHRKINSLEQQLQSYQDKGISNA